MRSEVFPDHFSVNDLVSHAKKFHNRTIEECASSFDLDFAADLSKVGKGGLGNVLEAMFGLDQNNRAEADFIEAKMPGSDVLGLELKLVPLHQTAKGLAVKERLVLGTINYTDIQFETWEESKARSKMNRMLNIFVDYNRSNLMQSKVRYSSLWELSEPIESILQQDWDRCQKFVLNGKAHELSERFFQTLSPCRKGAGGEKDWVHYEGASEPAKRRAFSLKQGYMNGVFQNTKNQTTSGSIFSPNELKMKDMDLMLLEKINKLDGMSVGHVCTHLGLNLSAAKDVVSRLARLFLTDGTSHKRLIEVEDRGLILKNVPLSSITGKPWEATSFPRTNLLNLIECDHFEDHPLSELLSGIIFLPNLRPNRKIIDKRQIKFGKPVLWRPSETEWNTIEREWTMFRDHLRRYGFSCPLPGASQTEIIHMRPKAANNTKVEIDQNGNTITHQAFWLNQSFVQKILNTP